MWWTRRGGGQSWELALEKNAFLCQFPLAGPGELVATLGSEQWPPIVCKNLSCWNRGILIRRCWNRHGFGAGHFARAVQGNVKRVHFATFQKYVIVKVKILALDSQLQNAFHFLF